MATEKKPVEYVDFIRGVNNPKRNWIIAQLVILGVTHRVEGMSFNGPVLQVKQGQIEKAHGVLNMTVGIMNTGGALTDENIKVMDLVDNHPLFVSKVDIGDIVTPVTNEEIAKSIEEAVDAMVETLPAVAPQEATPLPLSAEDADAILADIIAKEPSTPPTPLTVPADEPPVPEIIADELAGPELLELEAAPDEEGPFAESDVEDDEDPFADDTDDLWGTDDEDDEELTEDPELDYLRAEKVLDNADAEFAGVAGPVHIYYVDSANLTGFGANISQKDQERCTFYVQFKGGPNPYRYAPVSTAIYYELLGEAVRKGEGRQEASVGSLYHNLVKVDAEAGKIKCQRLAEGKWVEVLPKSQRLKAVKAKHNK